MITLKQYKSGKVHTEVIDNCKAYRDWYGNKVSYPFQSVLHRNNSQAFERIFGKPNWHFKGSEYRFSVWVLEHEGETFLIFAAQNKGTCVEIVSDFDSLNDKTDKIISFVKYLLGKILADELSLL